MPRTRWTAEAANDWYKTLPWLVGCNYTPRTAINPLEMWQADTFDPQTIDQELGWAASIGMNSVRVFLHDLLWQQDAGGFCDRVDRFLSIADKHGIGTMLVFFDSCWHPFPHLGRQPEPEPGVHNSGWVQSPGVAVLRDEHRFDELEGYVAGMVRRFANDRRVLIWDVWNEPDNNNYSSRGVRDLGDRKGALAAQYLPRVFAWARSADPSQPLTSAPWSGDWSCDFCLKPYERVQLEESDVISFHCYAPEEFVRVRIQQLQRYNRPLMCTEYMARGAKSTFDTSLPAFKEHRVGAYNWGLVAGKTQTHLPWDSWQTPYPPEPPIWFHEVFRPDGTPYRAEEALLLRTLTGRGAR